MEAATSTKNASYQPHRLYLQRMLTSRFCLAPRGDSASSRRHAHGMGVHGVCMACACMAVCAWRADPLY